MARLAWSREPSEGLGKASKVWTGSPQHRRVTRSQSQLDLEEGRLRQRTQPGDDEDDEQTLLDAGAGAGGRWGGPSKGRVSGMGLDVIEESPVQPSQTPRPRYETQIIPESPDNEVDISGTTALVSEPDDNLKHDLMIEALPDLERAAKNVLDLLVPASEDPVGIVNAAKKLTDPSGTQSRRLTRSMENMDREAEHFGHHTYINVEQVSRLLLSALQEKNGGLDGQWSPSPVLQRANCARFALEILLAKPGRLPKSGPSTKRAIWNVEGQFPLPFMTNLSLREDGHATGRSFLEKDTFKLALEIRTQYLIMQLEEHQPDDDFDPLAILSHGFFLNIPEGYIDDVEPQVRGFNLEALRGPDGELPSTYRTDVEERFNDMRLLLEEDDTFDIEVFKGAYRWHRFLLRAVQWIRKRNDEIGNDAKVQRSAEDVKERFFAKPKARHSLASTLGFSTPASQRIGRFSTVGRMTATPSDTRHVPKPSPHTRGSTNTPKAVTPSDTGRVSRPSPQAQASTSTPKAATPSDAERLSRPSPQTHGSTNTPKAVTPSDAPHISHPSSQPKDSSAQKTATPSTVLRDLLNIPVIESSERMSAPPSAVKNNSRPLPDTSRITHSAVPEVRDRRKPFRPSLLSQAYIARLAERQRQQQTSAEAAPSDPRRSEPSPTEATEQNAFPRQPEEHTFFDASRTLLNDDTEIIDNSGVNDGDTWVDETEILVNDETLDISAHTESHVERSHSPPMRSASRHRQERASIQPMRSIAEIARMSRAPRPSTVAPSNSRLAFIDRQENAVRVSPVSQGDPRSTERRPVGQPPKRRWSSSESSSASSNDGFDTDDREVATERRRAEKPAQPQTKRARMGNEDDSTSEDDDLGQPASRESARPVATAPTLVPRRTAVQRNRRPSPTSAPVRGRPTVGWSAAEDRRLIRLIEEFGPKWSMIERENDAQDVPEGEARFKDGQVQIKDRARNLKIKFYRHHLPIPKNFAGVTMKATDIRRLQAHNIDTTRQE